MRPLSLDSSSCPHCTTLPAISYMPSRKKAKSNDAGRSKPSGPSKHAAAEGENIPVRRPRCRRGGLEDMPNLPLDVLLEVS